MSPVLDTVTFTLSNGHLYLIQWSPSGFASTVTAATISLVFDTVIFTPPNGHLYLIQWSPSGSASTITAAMISLVFDTVIFYTAQRSFVFDTVTSLRLCQHYYSSNDIACIRCSDFYSNGYGCLTPSNASCTSDDKRCRDARSSWSWSSRNAPPLCSSYPNVWPHRSHRQYLLRHCQAYFNFSVSAHENVTPPEGAVGSLAIQMNQRALDQERVCTFTFSFIAFLFSTSSRLVTREK